MGKQNVIVALLVVMVLLVAVQTIQLMGIGNASVTGQVTSQSSANGGFSSNAEMMEAHHGSSAATGNGMVGGC